MIWTPPERRLLWRLCWSGENLRGTGRGIWFWCFVMLKWGKSSGDRQRDMVLMLCHVDLPSLSSSNLKILCHAAQSLGSSGADWECEVKEALSLHQKRPSSEVSRAHHPKRRCLSHWAAGLGASRESDRAGKKLTPTVKKCGHHARLYEGAFFLSRIKPSQLLSCKPGEETLRVVAGEGAPMNGFNQLECVWGLAMLPNGEMIVGHGDADEETQLLSFHAGVGKVLLAVPDLIDVYCSPDGMIYVLDAGGTRVQKVEGSRLMPVVDSKELPEEHAFHASNIFVSKQEVLYISDSANARILRFAEGTSVPTVVAEFGDRDGVDLSGLFVTEDERIFVCDSENRRILMADAGENTCWSELDVTEHGFPQDLLVQDGFLDVLIRRGTQEGWEGWVQQFPLPPTLEPWWRFYLRDACRQLAEKTCIDPGQLNFERMWKKGPRIHEVMSWAFLAATHFQKHLPAYARGEMSGCRAEAARCASESRGGWVLGRDWRWYELCMAVPTCAWHDDGTHSFVKPSYHLNRQMIPHPRWVKAYKLGVVYG